MTTMIKIHDLAPSVCEWAVPDGHTVVSAYQGSDRDGGMRTYVVTQFTDVVPVVPPKKVPAKKKAPAKKAGAKRAARVVPEPPR